MRFGLIAADKGFITIEQLIEAMNIQIREDFERKHHRPVGVILVELGHMTSSQVLEVLKQMGI